jgi:chromosome segregation ATPase
LPKVEELEELVNKFEDRVKLGGLINEKRFAELELKIGELNQKLNEVTTDFPKMKERAVEVEDLLNIINLGLVEYKDNFDKINSSFSEFKKIPETLESVRTNLESKMRELNDSVTSLTANVDVLKNIKEDIIKSSEETISSKIKTVEDGIQQNKVELEHVKRDLDGFSVALRSFERTIELTNLDDIIRRFDSLDRKIINNGEELDKIRKVVPDMSMTIVDVEILKKKFKEMSSTVMDVLNKINESEINTNKKMSLFEDLAKKVESANEEVKTQVSKLEENRTAVEKIYSDVNEKVSGLTSVNDEVNRLKTGIEELKGMKSSSDQMITEVKTDVGKVYNYVNEKVSGLTNVNEEISKIKASIEDLKMMRSRMDEMASSIKNEIITEVKSQLTPDYGVRISKLEEQINNVSSDLDKTLANIREQMDKKGSENVNKLEYEPLREKIEDIEKSIVDINKSLFNRPKMDVEPRVLKVDNVIKEVPKNIADEIVSLRNILSRLSSENDDLKKVIRNIRFDQMETITTDVFVGVTARISTIEKKLSEVEEEISKMRSNQ